MKQMLLVFISMLFISSCSKDEHNIELELPTNWGSNIHMVVGNKTFAVSLYDNSTAEAFLAMLPITMDMEEINGNEKYFDLPNSIPAAAVRPGTIRNGDIMLYGSSTFVLFHETFSSSYSYTRIGRVDNPSELKATLGRGNATVRFEKISEPIRYTLTYDTNGATDGATPPAVTADSGTNVSLSLAAGLSRDGYTFVEWNTKANGGGTNYPAGGSYTIDGNATLYAQWNIINNNNSMKVTIGSTPFKATLATNTTATAFKTMLPLTLHMSDFNNNEKVVSLPRSLNTAATNPGSIHTGDIMLYGSSSLVLFYETFATPYSYTRIGRIDDVEGLKTVLGTGNVTVKFELE